MAGRKDNRHYKPLSDKVIRGILSCNPKQEVPIQEGESSQCEEEPSSGILRTLSRRVEFDSINPEDQIRTFLTFVRNVQARYNENARRLEEYHQQELDLNHYAELSENLNARDGYAYYKKVRDMRRARRECKNENELLKPLIEFLSTAQSQNFINQLSETQGRCRNAKATISSRTYTMRTNVL